MQRWTNALNKVAQAAGGAQEQPDKAAGPSGVRFGAVEEKPLEPNVKIVNLRERLHMISRTNKAGISFDAIADLIEEARFNKSAIVDDVSAAGELVSLLQMPHSARRAVHLREITEFGRNIEFPPAWHGSDRKRTCVWYHVLQRLRLVEFEEGDQVIRAGKQGSCAYWVLSEDAVVRCNTKVVRAEREAAARAAAAAAAATAAAAAAAAEAAKAAEAAAANGAARSRTLPRNPSSLPTTPQLTGQLSTKLSTSSSLARGGGSQNGSPFASHQPSMQRGMTDLGAVGGTTMSRSHSAHVPPLDVRQPSWRMGDTGTTQPVSPGRPLSSSGCSAPAQLSHRSSAGGGAVAVQGSTTDGDSGTAAVGVPQPYEGEGGEEEEDEEETPDVALEVWDLIGQEALLGEPYAVNVVATGKLQLACLSYEDYRTILSEILGNETFESLKIVHTMMMNRARRTPTELKELAGQLSLFDLFRTMDEEFRLEVCNLVEYMQCPEGFTLFEEGDKIDFCYVILQGKVLFSKYEEKNRRQEEIGVKVTGEHFGTLLTLSSGEKKRPFTAITATMCELAIISRVGYNRILKKQLQGAIAARIALLQSLNIMNTQSYGALQRVATNCQDETFLPGVTIIDPTFCPSKIYVIMEGEAKMVYVTEDPNKPPQDTPLEPPPTKKTRQGQSQLGDGSSGNGPNNRQARDSVADGVGSAEILQRLLQSGRVSGSGTDGAGMGDRSGSLTRMGNQSASGNTASSSLLDKRQDVTISTAQQLGNVALVSNAGPRMAGGKRRHEFEISRMSKGDIINGLILFGKTPVFSVIACTQMKVISLEAESVEAFVGREACRQLKELISRGHTWAVERVTQMMSVRQVVGGQIMDPTAHRHMRLGALHHFMEHYVPRGVTELQEEANATAAAAAQRLDDALAASGLTTGAMGGVTSMPMISAGALGAVVQSGAAGRAGAGSPKPHGRIRSRSNSPTQQRSLAGFGSSVTDLLSHSHSVAPAPSVTSMDEVLRVPVATVPGVLPPVLGSHGHRSHGGHGLLAPPPIPPPALIAPRGTLAAVTHAAAAAAAASTAVMYAAVASTGGQPTQFVRTLVASPEERTAQIMAIAGVKSNPGQTATSNALLGPVPGQMQHLHHHQRKRKGRGRHMMWAGQVATTLLDMSEEPTLKPVRSLAAVTSVTSISSYQGSHYPLQSHPLGSNNASSMLTGPWCASVGSLSEGQPSSSLVGGHSMPHLPSLHLPNPLGTQTSLASHLSGAAGGHTSSRSQQGMSQGLIAASSPLSPRYQGHTSTADGHLSDRQSHHQPSSHFTHAHVSMRTSPGGPAVQPSVPPPPSQQQSLLATETSYAYSEEGTPEQQQQQLHTESAPQQQQLEQQQGFLPEAQTAPGVLPGSSSSAAGVQQQQQQQQQPGIASGPHSASDAAVGVSGGNSSDSASGHDSSTSGDGTSGTSDPRNPFMGGLSGAALAKLLGEPGITKDLTAHAQPVHHIDPNEVHVHHRDRLSWYGGTTPPPASGYDCRGERIEDSEWEAANQQQVSAAAAAGAQQAGENNSSAAAAGGSSDLVRVDAATAQAAEAAGHAGHSTFVAGPDGLHPPTGVPPLQDVSKSVSPVPHNPEQYGYAVVPLSLGGAGLSSTLSGMSSVRPDPTAPAGLPGHEPSLLSTASVSVTTDEHGRVLSQHQQEQATGRQLMSPLPRNIPNAPSPVLVSPSLKSKVLMQKAVSPVTAQYCQKRTATLVSGILTPEGDLDVESYTPRQQPGVPTEPSTASLHPHSSVMSDGTHGGSLQGLGPSVHSFGPLGGGMGRSRAATEASSNLVGGNSYSSLPASPSSPSHFSLPGLHSPGVRMQEPGGLHRQSAPAPGEGAGKGGGHSSTVVILPRMLNVYASVITNPGRGRTAFPRLLGANRQHRRRRSASYSPDNEHSRNSINPPPGKAPWQHAQHAAKQGGATGKGSGLQGESSARSLGGASAAGGGGLGGPPSLRSLAGVDGVGGSSTGSRSLRRSWSSRRRASMRDRSSRSGATGEGGLEVDDRGLRVVRMIAVNREHEPPLPLDTDHRAPILTDHKLSRPTLNDIQYIIKRWGQRWASERDEEVALRRRRPEVFAKLSPRTQEAVSQPTQFELDFERPMESLDLFGAPVAGPGRDRKHQQEASGVDAAFAASIGLRLGGQEDPGPVAVNDDEVHIRGMVVSKKMLLAHHDIDEDEDESDA